MGNCGVGFAPCNPGDRQGLIDLMEGVEDIPGFVLAEGLPWNWQTFPEFLDVLEGVPRALDVGAQIPHHALRVYVMGERALRHEAATPADIDRMRRITEEALRAGAFGFTTSRTRNHRTVAGDIAPGYYAQPEELLGIGKALKTVGRGAFGMLNEFADEEAEFAWMRALGRDIGRPIWFMMSNLLDNPGRWARLMGKVRAANDDGIAMAVQIPCRPIGMICGLTSSIHPFQCKPTFLDLVKRDSASRLARLRDPAIRAAIIGEESDPAAVEKLAPILRAVLTNWNGLYVLTDPPDYETPPGRSMAGIAAREGRSPAEVCYDFLLGNNGRNMAYFPLSAGNEFVHNGVSEAGTIPGGGDGGAHCGVICDASMVSFMIAHWGRDTPHGAPYPIEWLVRRQTAETAAFHGFTDRGLLKPGMRADINLIDFDRLRLHLPEAVLDLPAGGRRLVQRVDGYVMTMVAGQTILENGQATGALPGKLVRAGR